MAKPCEVCSYPERTAVEEALERGESYRDLKQSFKLSIGAMKRHRKGHLGQTLPEESFASGESSAADLPGDEASSEETYVRFGAAPKGGTSWNYAAQESEEGLSVFDADKDSLGNYTLYINEEGGEESFIQLKSLVHLITLGRRVYEAFGEECGVGGNGEPLLSEVSLDPIPRHARVHLPEWVGQEGKKLEAMWNRRGRCRPTRALVNQGVSAIVEAGEVLDPYAEFVDRATRTRAARQVFAPEVHRAMGWK